MNAPLRRVVDALGSHDCRPRETGSGWSAKCPAHDDHEPSLSVTVGRDRVLVHCFAGCPPEAIARAVGFTLADLRLERPSTNERKWTQDDADRALSQRGLRRETIEHFQIVADLKKQAWSFPLGTSHPMKYKAFLARTRRKYWSQKGAKLGCYQLDLCIGQPEACLVEGECDVWPCWQASVPAFSLTGGAGKINSAAVETIIAAKIGVVLIVYDRDEAGRNGAAKVAAALRKAGQAVTVRELPKSVGSGGDVTTLYNNLGGDDAAFHEALAALPEAPESLPRPVDDKEEPLTLTDTGNATRLVAMHGPHLRYIAPWDRWLVWNGTVWQRDDGAVRVRERAKDVGFAIRREAAQERDVDLAESMFKFGCRSLSAGGISAMVNLARGIPGILLDHERLDSDAYLLGVVNGVVDLRTGSLRSADPADLMTMQASIRCDPDARAPRWERAMQEWFPDADVRAYVQRVAGSALVGAQHERVNGFWGQGRAHLFQL